MSYLHGAVGQAGALHGRYKRTDGKEGINAMHYLCGYVMSPLHTHTTRKERGNLGFESVETGKKGRTDKASEGLELARSQELATQLMTY